GEAAALSLMRVTSPRASAKASRGVSQPPVAAKAAPVMQQRQKWRRESRCFCRKLIASSSRSSVSRSDPSRRRAWTRSFCSVADKPRRAAFGGIATPQRCRLVGRAFTGLPPARERRLIASPMLKDKASWRVRLAHSSLGDLHESLLDELCRSCHGIRIDLDVRQQVLVSPAMSLCGRAAKLDLHAALLQIGIEILGGVDSR